MAFLSPAGTLKDSHKKLTTARTMSAEEIAAQTIGAIDLIACGFEKYMKAGRIGGHLLPQLAELTAITMIKSVMISLQNDPLSLV